MRNDSSAAVVGVVAIVGIVALVAFLLFRDRQQSPMAQTTNLIDIERDPMTGRITQIREGA